ncbi:MAG: hypothetical protein FWF57_08730 [Defluviitaleaceae bacterium]|nr:hypothetical protein [Defluviitaleaceae bacterium]
MISFIVGATVFLSMFGFFLFAYKGNKSTPVPEGVDVEAALCDSCRSTGGCKFTL